MTNSIIIPFHSNSNLLSACLDSITKTINNDDEIIVVANNANRDALKFDFSKYACKVIYKYDNLMYPTAMNIGAAYAKGTNLIFCDADICVTNDWLINLVGNLDKTKEVGYTSAKLLDFHTKDIWEFGTACSIYNFPHPHKYRKINFKLCEDNRIVWGACAACSAISKEDFINIGGFDEKLVCSYSDLDLCIRLKESYGLNTLCVADSLVYHQGGSTINSGMGTHLKEDTKGIFTARHPKIVCNIHQYLKMSVLYFLKLYGTISKEVFCVNLSSIANPELYIDYFFDLTDIKSLGEYKKPILQRDANYIDLINNVHHSIRSYHLPIIYFVDSFIALKNNVLWKECRKDYPDIVIDRHANVELLSQI